MRRHPEAMTETMHAKPLNGAPALPSWGAAIGPAEFADYMACFNGGDFPGFAKYFADDVLFEGRGRHLEGRAAVVDFYSMVKARMRETSVASA